MTTIYLDGQSAGVLEDTGESPSTRTVRLYLIAYVVLLHLIPISNMLGLGRLVPGTLLTFVFAAISIWLTLIYAVRRVETRGPTFTTLDGLVAAYAVYCLGSFFFYLQPGHPVTPVAFLYGVNHLLFPLPLFFAAKLVKSRDQESILRTIVYLNVGMVISGLILFYLRPGFYTSYLSGYFEESRNLVTAEVLYVRLNSYVGSTAVGVLSALTIVLTARTKFPRAIGPLIVSLMVIAAMLSQQRGGIAGAAIGVIYFLVAGSGRARTRILSIVVAIGIVVSLALVFESRFSGVLGYTADKALSSGSALSERFHSYQVGWDYFTRFPLGLGLGATSSAVYNAGLIVGEEVTDANFARILADLGIVGVTIFVVLLWSTFTAALRRKDSLAWIAILAIYVLVSLGTNVFDVFYVAHIFWLFAGIIDTREQSLLPITSALNA